MNFPPKVRVWFYRVQYGTSGAMLLIGVGYGAASESLPKWYGVTAAVLSAAWSYLGLTAAQNTPGSAEGGGGGGE